jgi:hypothetical protein
MRPHTTLNTIANWQLLLIPSNLVRFYKGTVVHIYGKQVYNEVVNKRKGVHSYKQAKKPCSRQSAQKKHDVLVGHHCLFAYHK